MCKSLAKHYYDSLSSGMMDTKEEECRCQQIRIGDLTIESPWPYPLSHNSSILYGIPTKFEIYIYEEFYRKTG